MVIGAECTSKKDGMDNDIQASRDKEDKEDRRKEGRMDNGQNHQYFVSLLFKLIKLLFY